MRNLGITGRERDGGCDSEGLKVSTSNPPTEKYVDTWQDQVSAGINS